MKNEPARSFFSFAWTITNDAVGKLERKGKELYENVLAGASNKEGADEIIRELSKLRDYAHKHLRRIDKDDRP